MRRKRTKVSKYKNTIITIYYLKLRNANSLNQIIFKINQQKNDLLIYDFIKNIF